MKPFRIIPHKKKKGLCVAHGCGNDHAKKNRFCPKHAHRFQKYRNPYNYTFNQKKNRAKERGTEWKLTLEEFIEFCEANNYMNEKGRTANAASIDRKNAKKGYEKGNLQILTLAENTAKMHEDRKNDCPF